MTETEQCGEFHEGDLASSNAKLYSGKISKEFADRLAALPPTYQVRAVVLPAPYLIGGSSGERVHGTRVQGEERQAILREARTRTEQTFAEIDSVLAAVGGQRLTDCGNALGYIVVETIANGIAAITDLNWVGTVLEDQAIRPVHQVESPSTR